MQAYDKKNQQDFDAVTEKINEALKKMRSDDSIKSSVQSLADLSGVHRNTLNNRIWPVEQVKAIKAERKAKLETQKNEPKVDPLEKASEKLSKAEKEILFWYGKTAEYKELYESMTVQFTDMAKSRDLYKTRFQELETVLTTKETELARAIDLLNMVEK